MTEPLPPERLTEHLQRAVAELLPEAEEGPVSPMTLTRAGRIVAERQNIAHRIMHADAQRGGAVVWGMRQAGMTWRQIYDATGIVQRTGSRWMDLFIQEGVSTQAAEDLDRRWQGLDGTEKCAE